MAAFAQNSNLSRDCQTNPLRAVYNPKRLKVVRTCQQLEGTVVHVSKERDGDLHIQLAVADKSLLTPRNYSGQSGYLVAEYMPGDPYPRPAIGQALRLGCTYVYDLQHGGWAECHPVWSVQPLGATPVEP